MTTIAAKLVNGKVHMAWDSLATAGGIVSSKYRNKVAMVNGQFAVGVAGRVRYSNIVQRASVNLIHPADLTHPGFDAEGWVTEQLVPAWMHSVKEMWHLTPKDEGDEVPWGEALVSLAGNIFRIGGDFSVVNCGEHGAIGSGSPYAQTALHLGKSAKQAVQIACELDLYSGGEVKELKV